jgi:hypothetical protein
LFWYGLLMAKKQITIAVHFVGGYTLYRDVPSFACGAKIPAEMTPPAKILDDTKALLARKMVRLPNELYGTAADRWQAYDGVWADQLEHLAAHLNKIEPAHDHVSVQYVACGRCIAFLDAWQMKDARLLKVAPSNFNAEFLTSADFDWPKKFREMGFKKDERRKRDRELLMLERADPSKPPANPLAAIGAMTPATPDPRQLAADARSAAEAASSSVRPDARRSGVGARGAKESAPGGAVAGKTAKRAKPAKVKRARQKTKARL